MDWMWGERERGESRVTTGFLASATELMVVPFTYMGSNQEEQILVRVGRREQILSVLMQTRP